MERRPSWLNLDPSSWPPYAVTAFALLAEAAERRLEAESRIVGKDSSVARDIELPLVMTPDAKGANPIRPRGRRKNKAPL